jgi:oligopeptide transport system permease protein
MLKFILRRIFLEAFPTLLILVTVTFFLIRLAPGGPFSSEMNVPPEVMAAIEAKYQLDKPLPVQYLGYLADLARGDLGPSFKYKDFTVNELVNKAIPVSFKLGIVAFIIALVVGISAGVAAALRQNTWIDYSVMGVAMIGVVLPNFVLAPMLALVFAVWFKILPAGGWEGGQIMFMILPVTVLCKHYISVIARITRGSMIEVLGSPFIRTARAKGLPMHYILRRHALKPAMLPVVSYLGPAFVGVITGSIVVETFFGIPGIGQLFINGALNRDYSMVLGLTILIGTLTITFNAVVDILYGYIDPRIRVQ